MGEIITIEGNVPKASRSNVTLSPEVRKAFVENYDNNYTIVSLVGVLFYDYNIQDCYKKMDEIIENLDGIFEKQKKIPKSTYKHPNPKNVDGKSIITEVEYQFKNGDIVVIACYDYSKEHGAQDHLSVAIDTASFDKWLSNEAYK